MTDIALLWDNEAFGADLALTGGDLATDDGLRTAFLISLFTDARARADDVLPQAGGDPRGWWGDAFGEDQDGPIGSRLWLLDREKRTGTTLTRARDYATEAVAWLIAASICTSIDIEVEAQGEALAIALYPTRPGGPARQRFDFLWTGSI
ncbi:MAG TPA: phage GP46 family protein [Sphingobium sp.]